MSKKNPLIYYVVFHPYSKLLYGSESPLVRAVYLDGTTRDWKPDTRGFKAARSRAMRANRR